MSEAAGAGVNPHVYPLRPPPPPPPPYPAAEQATEGGQPDRMDVAEFRAAGYLQEINRRLLHPLGLALSVEVLPDGTERFAGIWDHRDDPEGILYGPGVIDAGKAGRVERELDERTGPRWFRLGYVVQPVDS